MLKDGCEIDMRGRCSAGQKVLACILIRLALAESFCINCGIIALDEPTTNLDEPNIEALASALGSIVENRKGAIQLIVITHDEKFLEMMQRSESAEYYWYVDKNARGYSRVTRMSMG
jgi:DNA repair protein RAD50